MMFSFPHDGQCGYVEHARLRPSLLIFRPGSLNFVGRRYPIDHCLLQKAQSIDLALTEPGRRISAGGM
jgi:hypothetical protein